MGDPQAKKPLEEYRQSSRGSGRQEFKRPRALIFVPVRVEHQYNRPLLPQPSWWLLCTNWFHYHSMQIRWDIERRLAQLLHRRWGG